MVEMHTYSMICGQMYENWDITHCINCQHLPSRMVCM